MFYFEIIKSEYYIGSDKIDGKFGPFSGIYCKNKYIGEIEKNAELEKKYPGYKYSFGIIEKKLFIINKRGIEDIILL